MFLENLTFPATLAFGAIGGPGWSTGLVAAPSGYEQLSQRWSHIRGSWEVGQVNRTGEETKLLIAIFNVAHGRLHGFRFHDPEAGEGTGIDEPLGVGTGSQATYQLIKRYTLGGETYDRPITKPVVGTVSIKVNGTPTTSFLVNTATGIVTMTATNGAGITASYSFDVPVRFNVDQVKITCVEPYHDPTRSGANARRSGFFTWPSILLVETRDIT